MAQHATEQYLASTRYKHHDGKLANTARQSVELFVFLLSCLLKTPYEYNLHLFCPPESEKSYCCKHVTLDRKNIGWARTVKFRSSNMVQGRSYDIGGLGVKFPEADRFLHLNVKILAMQFQTRNARF